MIDHVYPNDYAVSLEPEAYPGAVAGFRAFLFEYGELKAMTSAGAANPTQSNPAWSPGVNKAHCPKRIHAEEAPAASCTCGFWMHRTVEDLMQEEIVGSSHSHYRPIVIGLVAGWGKISDHTRGMRVQYARPIAFLEVHRRRLDPAFNPFSSPWYVSPPVAERTFAVPEELVRPRSSPDSGHEGRIEVADIPRVIREYGLTELPAKENAIYAQFRRKPGVANGQDEFVFAPAASPELSEAGFKILAGENSRTIPREPCAGQHEGLEKVEFGSPYEHECFGFSGPSGWLDSIPGSVPGPTPESHLTLARDALRMSVHTRRTDFLRGNLKAVLSRLGMFRLGQMPGSLRVSSLARARSSAKRNLRLVELAISGEHLTPETERTERQDRHIDFLFGERARYARYVDELEEEIRKAERDAELAEKRVGERPGVDSGYYAIEWGWPSPPTIHYYAPHHPAPVRPPAPGKPLPNLNQALSSLEVSEAPRCCPPGTHLAKNICRRVFLLVCRVCRNASEAAGKLRPEVFRGARPSNASPLWYTFHRKEK